MEQSKKRHYWLGGDEVNAQDTFFLEALDMKIWSVGTKDKWDTCWAIDMPDREVFEKLDVTKSMNHIPGNSALTIKSNLHKTLTNAKKRVSGLPQEQRYSFYPDTYSMPEDYFKFQEVAAENPDWMWIQKPKNLSRGRGIEVVKHPEMVPMDNEWIIQRYLSKPHLWDGYKYVLRCYVLITSVEPLRFYWFHEGFAKLTSEPYSNEDLDNPYRHLTNPDINEDNTDVDVPVVFHSFKAYRKWLKDQGVDDEKLFADLHDLIALTVISARESMRIQLQKVDADTQGTYELIGLDCMVEEDLKPWILECNLSPSLETCSTLDEKGEEETLIKRQLVQDIVNILGLNDLDKSDNLDEQQKAAYEQERAGGFQCVFPTENANHYLHCFPVPRYADVASLPDGTKVDQTKIPLQTQEGLEAVFSDSLALLYGKNTKDGQHFIFPNEIATMIWLQNSAGYSPDEIAAELTAAYNEAGNTEFDEEKQLSEIWDVLADWSQANLFVKTQDFASSTDLQGHDDVTADWVNVRTIEHSGVAVTIRSACPLVASYIDSLFKNNFVKSSEKHTLIIDVLRSHYGYVMTSHSNVIASGQKLSMLGNKIFSFIAEHCLNDSNIAVTKGIVACIAGRNTLIISDSPQLDTWAHELVSSHEDSQLLSAAAILDAKENVVSCTDFPLFLADFKDDNSKSDDKFLAVAEKSGEAYQLYTTGADISCKIKIESLLFLQLIDDESLDDQPIQELRNADMLVKLWESSTHKHVEAASLLPNWLEGIRGMMINVSDNEEQSLLSAIKVLK